MNMPRLAHYLAYEANAMAAKLMLDVLNGDPAGAGRQYPPLIMQRTEDLVCAVEDAYEGCRDVMFSVEPYTSGIPFCVAGRVDGSDDELIRRDLVDILRTARAALLATGRNTEVKFAFNRLLNEVMECNDAYWGLDLSDWSD